MNSHRFALLAAVAAATIWALKATVIGLAGGLDKSPAEGPLFFAGLVAFVTTVVALGIAATAGARTWVRALAGVGTFVAATPLFLAVDGIISAIRGPENGAHWVWTELNLWIIALLALAAAILLHRGRESRAVRT